MDMIIKNISVYQTFTQQFEIKDVFIKNGRFAQIADSLSVTEETVIDGTGLYMVPGLIDIHMHIESSMTLPSRFSQAVLPHGVTTVVADPHEIANVFGIEGIQSFLSNATALDIFYGIPSSVPSTSPHLETTGGLIGVDEVKELLNYQNILCLGEVMNFQDLCKKESSTIKDIIKLCQEFRPSLPIEGHCPKISGKDLADFIAAGVTADHTQQTPESIIEKIKSGMFLEIQKKSMTKQTIQTLMDYHFYDYFAFVTDDVMADKLPKGHLNEIIKYAVKLGMPVEKAIYCSTYTPARRMHLEDRGMIAPGRLADFILLTDVDNFKIHSVYKGGCCVANDRESHQENHNQIFPDHFYHSIKCKKAEPEDFDIKISGNKVLCNIIQTQPHSTFTKHIQKQVPVKNGILDYESQNLCLLTVYERYGKNGNIAHALLDTPIKKRGAIATSWAHDHHNVMVMGNDKEDMMLAQQMICEMQGGYVVVKEGQVLAKAYLEIGGIVSAQPIEVLAQQLRDVRSAMQELGYVHDNEIMSFSTLSLPVSPQLKVTDMGMINTLTQEIVPLIAEVYHEDVN